MLEPKTISITLRDGGVKEYTISKFPAVAGREIIAKYPISAMPKLGDYEVNEKTMLKLMSYVSIDAGGSNLPLSTEALINNHVPDWETLAKLEWAMMEYNVSFLENGKISDILMKFKTTGSEQVTSILTDLLGRSLAKTKQRSKS